jgi:3-hydroxyisobutyrate dehydrogenase-like beta-hydroxyacid dehydrogenase
MSRTIALIGSGYVGPPVATAFGHAKFKVFGCDVNSEHVAELHKGSDPTHGVSAEDIAGCCNAFTSTQSDLRVADFYIVAVPTPIIFSRSITEVASNTRRDVNNRADEQVVLDLRSHADRYASLRYRAFAAGGRPMPTRLLAGRNVIVLDIKGVLDRIARLKNIDLWQM